jgi:exo-beta-1,3-glucanase (GH17 family)/cellulose synthase/poly-beta-1,6-N-acetylglucosamine synthase-like glycosyltransferase
MVFERHMKKHAAIFADLLIAIAFAVVTFSLWAFFNRPLTEPPWPERIQGFSFAPYRTGQDGRTGIHPSQEEIKADLKLLAGKTHAVRTYTVEGPLALIASLAKPIGINVAQGIWISDDLIRNRREVELGKMVAWTHRNVVRVIVGNEVVLRKEIPIEDLCAYLDEVREAVWQPVSTAEPWHVWIKHPELAEHVDFIAVHMLPFWEGIGVIQAVTYTIDKIELLERTFPGKPIVIGEVGWPSNGRTRMAAVASPANEALFLRRFIHEAEQRNWVYYVMEAFDQPWKTFFEGGVGAYWGVYNSERQPKFPFSAPVVPVTHWKIVAGLSVLVALIIMTLLLFDSRALRKRGRSFLAVTAFAAATAAVWVVYDYSRQYWTLYMLSVGLLLFTGLIGVILVLLAEAHEWAEANWALYRRRLPFAAGSPPGTRRPMVSIHVPAYNEPPAMLCATLDALAALNYPDFEVIVVDNNTRDPDVWQPVAVHCRRLGERFRFFHVAPLDGFKAGALNFALARTNPEAEVVAVIDSDYRVHPDWLADLVPLFDNAPRTAIVQAPQDYHDGDANVFKAMMYAEYRGFFYIGMITRNERNAIIQHGTMTLIRRRVLDDVDGWAEWCITEDAELGMRILARGYEAVYVPRSYGRGVMPDTIADYKKQRFRWAFGAMQIMRRHRGALLGPGRLTAGQRYHFIAGWLPWMADGFNLVFTLAALAWSAAMILWPTRVDAPLMVFAALPMALFGFKIVKMAHLYRTRVGAGLRQTLASALAGLTLTHTIGLAMINGMVHRDRAFFRTPKMARANRLLAALVACRQEMLLAPALWLAAWAVARSTRLISPDAYLWVIMLLVQSLPYAITVLVAVISGLPRLPAWLVGRSAEMETRGEEHLAIVSGVVPAVLGAAPPLPPVAGADDWPGKQDKAG